MQSAAVLLLVLCSALPLNAQTPGTCCQVKIVKDSPGNTLDGTYTFKKEGTNLDPVCVDGCIYTRDTGPATDEYCFQRSDAGATIEDKCDATPAGPGTPPAAGPATTPAAGPSTQAGPMTTASSAQLREQAEAAARVVETNNAQIAENNVAVEQAEASTSTIANIQAQLNAGVTTPAVVGRQQVREKRQAATNPPPTVKPVAKPDNCDDFKDIFDKLLDEAVKVSADNIDQIEAYSNALKDVKVKVICSTTEIEAVQKATSAKAEEAKTKTEEFVGKIEKENTKLKKEVNDALDIQNSVNKQLVAREEPTVPIQASTYKPEPPKETQAATEPPQGTQAGTVPPENPVSIPSEGTPAGTVPPENSVSIPSEGTPAGTVPENPVSTPKEAPATPQETPAPTQPPPKISTVPPARGLFFGRNKRSRGSIF